MNLQLNSISGHPWIVDDIAPDKPLDSAVLSRLKQFSAMNKLKKMALRVWSPLHKPSDYVCNEHTIFVIHFEILIFIMARYFVNSFQVVHIVLRYQASELLACSFR